jgi:hypothetical protein
VAAQAGWTSRARNTAALTSAAFDLATLQISRPVAGSIFENVRPSTAAAFSPPIWFGMTEGTAVRSIRV